MARTPTPARTAGSCTASSHEPALRRTAGHLAFLLPARGQLLRGAVRASRDPRHRGAGHCRPQQPRRHRAGASGGEGHRRPADRRLPPRSRWTASRCWSIPTDRPAYARLCRLLSLGKKRGGKAKCRLDWSDLVAYGEGLIAVLIPDVADDACALQLRRLRESLRRSRLSGADPAPPAERPAPAARAVQSRGTRRGCRPSSPTTCCSMCRRGASCRTSSPASAMAAPSTTLASAASAMPIATLSRPRRWRGCSAAIPRRSRARWRSPSAAASRSTNWPTSIRARR